MHRKQVFATAGAISVAALAGIVALGANFGLFGLTAHDGGPGRFKVVDASQVSPTPIITTEVVDIPVPAPSPAPSPTRSTTPRPAPVAASSGEVTTQPTAAVPPTEHEPEEDD